MFMRRLFFVLAILVSLGSSSQSFGQSWKLPHQINDSNTNVTFEVDSTFHLVQGKTSGITGSVKQSDTSDPLSIEVDLAIPVASFDTDWDSRDEKLAHVMAAQEFQTVIFKSSRLSPSCHPLRIAHEQRCTGTLEGTLTIRDVTKPVSLPAEIVREGNRDKISGKLTIAWAEYNVQDPSILIAKLDPSVTIAYSTEVPLR
jgi:polyisoprenoid-binding protein YceI